MMFSTEFVRPELPTIRGFFNLRPIYVVSRCTMGYLLIRGKIKNLWVIAVILS
jgi:hypothetical protein